ncbi:MAG: hypothetical protein WCP35_02200 [Verrucomicrobiota bacterium]
MNDTPSSVDQQFRTMLLAKSGAERMRMGSGMFDSARRLMLASLPKNLPPETIRQLLLARTYPELANPRIVN